jgi:hypothetical protein
VDIGFGIGTWDGRGHWDEQRQQLGRSGVYQCQKKWWLEEEEEAGVSCESQKAMFEFPLSSLFLNLNPVTSDASKTSICV